ncbi:hypothetical protein BJP39_30505 [Streptomyces sp. CC77]|nr:hypothetical protein BJP39_30505 [Streptomyces sp. CC77]
MEPDPGGFGTVRGAAFRARVPYVAECRTVAVAAGRRRDLGTAALLGACPGPPGAERGAAPPRAGVAVNRASGEPSDAPYLIGGDRIARRARSAGGRRRCRLPTRPPVGCPYPLRHRASARPRAVALHRTACRC